LAMVSSLGDMMRPSGHDHASDTSHNIGSFAWTGFISQKSMGTPVTVPLIIL
jgi:hypothetical protein